MREFADLYNTVLPYYVLVFSLFSFIVTVTDKILSKTSVRRVSERTFVCLSVLGGGLGVLSAFYIVRHKTKHGKLLAAVWASSILSYLVFIGVSVFFQINF